MDCPNSSGGPGDRSLPSMGMGLPRWMKRATERYDYTDICASPPSNEDGFFHINRNRLKQVPASDAGQTNVECYQKQRSFRTETADITSSVVELERNQHPQQYRSVLGTGTPFKAKIIATPATPGTSINLPADCISTPETTNFFKAVATTSPSTTTLTSSIQKQQIQDPTTLTTTTSVSSNLISSTGEIPTKGYYNTKKAERGNTYDSALDSGDIPSMIVSKPDRDREQNHSHTSLKQMIEKMNGLSNLPPTPEDTPNQTPTVTPACSPQVARRNPFFSGNPSQSTNNSGSWLFRSSSAVQTNNKGERVEEHNYLYEAKPGLSGVGGSNAATATAGGPTGPKPNVRYVPRPSELRELNFWSPTSM